MNLSEHFTVEELSVTHQTDAQGRVLGNFPVGIQLDYLTRLARTILEPVRDLWGCPVLVTSAYRSPAVERSVQEHAGIIKPGEALAPSQHMWGQAADIVPAGALDLDEAYRRVWASGIPFDQLLMEGTGSRRWIHISCAPPIRVARRQALTSPTGLPPWAVYVPPEPPKEGTA